MSELKVINLFAGKRPDGQDVVEHVRVIETEKKTYRLVKSPAFAHGIASGDEISYDVSDNSFELVSRSGNLCIRIYVRENMEAIKNNTVSAIEKLGGELDYDNERMLVFTIHVSCGFKNIEAILTKHCADTATTLWRYGNVYDPADGTTPLNWWLDLDSDSE